MMDELLDRKQTLTNLIENKLERDVRRIDMDAFYAKDYLKSLGEERLFANDSDSFKDQLTKEIELVKETAKTCMTTAFCLWCHLAALTYVRNTDNEELQADVLSALKNGTLLAGTGLSNPLKYLAGLEKLQLKAKRVSGGYELNGSLPYISNLQPEHSFAVIAKETEEQQVMCFVQCNLPGFKMRERTDYLGLNGSATMLCTFNHVFIPDRRVISKDVEQFVEKIRPEFITYQIPLGLGVIESAIELIHNVAKKQDGCNVYLPVQAAGLLNQKEALEERLNIEIAKPELEWKEIAKIRLETAYLTLEAVQAAMLHNGSAGYLRTSVPARKLREAYFFANLTPTIKHLEKLLHN